MCVWACAHALVCTAFLALPFHAQQRWFQSNPLGCEFSSSFALDELAIGKVPTVRITKGLTGAGAAYKNSVLGTGAM